MRRKQSNSTNSQTTLQTDEGDVNSLLQTTPSALLLQARETHLEWQRGAVNFRRRMFGIHEEGESEMKDATETAPTIPVEENGDGKNEDKKNN